MRPDEAPLVAVRDALENDRLLGRRVRISGRCSARGEGRRAGSWTLDQAGATIEVRGLVPSSCAPTSDEELTIFAQIEAKSAGSSDRILLRLPDSPCTPMSAFTTIAPAARRLPVSPSGRPELPTRAPPPR